MHVEVDFTPASGFCDWLEETLRRLSNHRKHGHLPDSVPVKSLENALLNALLDIKRWQDNQAELALGMVNHARTR